MTEQILELMTERRKHKRKEEEYIKINQLIKKNADKQLSSGCRKYVARCREALQKSHDTFNVHKENE